MNLPKNRWPRTGTAGWTKLPINPIHLQEGCVVPTNAGGVSCGGSDEWVGRNTTPENDLSGYGKQWGRATWLQTRLPLWTQLFTGSPPSPLKAMEPSIYAVLHAPLQSQLSLLKMEPHLENVVPFGSILNSFFFLPMRCLLSLLLSFAQSPWFSPLCSLPSLDVLGLLLSVFVLNGFCICASVTLFSE